MSNISLRERRSLKALRTRRKLRSIQRPLSKRSEGRLRLSVYRSLENIYAQIIDDSKGETLASASSLEAEVRGADFNSPTDVATCVGALLGKRASAKGILRVYFDRGFYRYHGRVKALAEEARKQGLLF